MNGARPASLAHLAIFSNDMEEAMTSAHELAQQRRTVFRRETERITRRIIRALKSAKLTSEDGLRDYGRLYWMIGKQLAVHCRRKSGTNNARSIAQGIMEALDEMGTGEIIRMGGK
jgi:hypothetical protein